MGRLSYSDFAESHKKFNKTQAVYCIFSSLIQDFLLYTIVIPLLGIYTSGLFVTGFELSARYETVLVIAVTFVLLYIAFSMFGEAGFWRYLFAFNQFYISLLQIRDLLNVVTLILCLAFLNHTIGQMVVDRQMKPHNLGEGATYVLAKFFAVRFNVYPGLVDAIGMKLPNSRVGSGENQRFLHAGAYILYWAMLTGCIAKLLYFNTLFTYIRSMRIFISLRPSFDDDSDLLSDSSSSSVSSKSRDSIDMDDDKVNYSQKVMRRHNRSPE